MFFQQSIKRSSCRKLVPIWAPYRLWSSLHFSLKVAKLMGCLCAKNVDGHTVKDQRMRCELFDVSRVEVSMCWLFAAEIKGTSFA
jgi:hypothetical protein